MLRPYQCQHDRQDPSRVNKPCANHRGPEGEERLPHEACAQDSEADAQEGAQRRVQDGRAHLRHGELDSLLQRPLALDELVHDVCRLVHADAQTHDQEEQGYDVQVESELLNTHEDDDHDVDDERADQDCAYDVVEDQVYDDHD